MKDFIKALFDLIAPARCIFCGRRARPGSYQCGNCGGMGMSLTRILNLPLGKNSRLMKVYSPHIYSGAYRKNLHSFKFRGKTAFAPAFASLMADTFRSLEGDLITAVPMTVEQIKKRGYNQSELIAREYSAITGVPYAGVLIKEKSNRPQHSLTAAQRKANVKGAFAVKGDIMGQKIILVDDIITTGSTLCECAGVLYKSGAAEVTGLCAADVETNPKSGNNAEAS